MVTILNYSEMPHVSGGLAVEIVIGSSSVLKRGTTSQMLEAAYTQYSIDCMSSDSITWSEAVQHHMDQRNIRSRVTDILSLYESHVFIQLNILSFSLLLMCI